MAGFFDILLNIITGRMVNKALDNANASPVITKITGPDDFVKQVWPIALKVHAQTGVRPELIMAQGSLESGWGLKGINNNLFGIKADSNWRGAKVLMKTREVKNGKSYFINDYFRVYSNMADSVKDHAQFLIDNPRYSSVFKTSDPVEQARRIAAAGYSTAPNYFTAVAAQMGSVLKRVKKFNLTPAPPTVATSQN